jgi:uncharacterized protein (TIGR03118 family)
MAKRAIPIIAALGLLAVMAAPVAAHDNGPGDGQHHRHHGENEYAVTTLVSDVGVAPVRADANLVNAWGLAALPTSPWWVANNHTDTSTLYDGTGAPRPLVVKVAGGPTGLIANTTTDFSVSGGGVSGVAKFIFATEAGTIRGWSPTVPAAGSTATEIGADRSSVGAIYKGLATGTVNGANYLFAADFHNGHIDVFNSTFTLQDWHHAFRDPRLPDGYAPFNVQNLGGWIFVTFAKQSADKIDEVAGRHLGFVDAFTADGHFAGRVASRGALNAPWGLAMAPAGFGRFSGDVLVGNFGDGKIHAYRMTRHGWRFDGTLRGEDHKAIAIDGLWALAFGNGSAAGPLNSLYFTAGPNGENNGAFGSIIAGD